MWRFPVSNVVAVLAAVILCTLASGRTLAQENPVKGRVVGILMGQKLQIDAGARDGIFVGLNGRVFKPVPGTSYREYVALVTVVEVSDATATLSVTREREPNASGLGDQIEWREPLRDPAEYARQREAEAERQRQAEAERQRQVEAERRSAESRPAAVHSASGDDVVSLGSGVSLRMKRIPAGSFMMGASPGDSDADGDEKPSHRVTISRDFYMGVTEVTQAQWRAVMGTNPSHFTGDDRPVENVSWEDAVAFCEKLSQRTGQRYRLPTEAEWEYAARAGTTTEYYWGTSMDGDFAWYNGNSGGQTHPVGQKRANAWGLYDMSGNVWEWCADWYDSDYYGQSPSTDPKGARSGGRRVLRGGSWSCAAWRMRVSNRVISTPGGRSYYGGFRLVREGS